MSSVFCANMAPGNPILFPQQQTPARVLEHLSASPKLASITQASRLTVRATPEMVSSGIQEMDAMTGGLSRGCLTEICGPASSGRTSVLLAALASATRRQEVCALVDASDAFDPSSAAKAGVDFERLLWVRCGETHAPQKHKVTEKKITIQKQEFGERTLQMEGVENHPALAAERQDKAHSVSSRNRAEQRLVPKERKTLAEGALEQALRATDLLLQSAGFGLIILDLGDIPFQFARRIPLTTWFRFQRAVETTPTIFFVIAESPLAQTCASLLVKLSAVSSQLSVTPGPSHVQLLEGLHVGGELLRSRQQRKPVQSVTAFITESFKLKAEG